MDSYGGRNSGERERDKNVGVCACVLPREREILSLDLVAYDEARLMSSSIKKVSFLGFSNGLGG